MKKTFPIIASVVAVIILSGCTPNEVHNFDGRAINTTPHFDIEKMSKSSWDTESVEGTGETGKPDRVQTDPAVDRAKEDTSENKAESKDIISYNYVLLNNTKNNCALEGRISYSESYKQARGDLFNSKDYLYSLVDTSQNPLTGEENITIGGDSFVKGYYKTPENRSHFINHMTAVRVFSTPVSIVGTTGFAENELGNHNSDLSLGLPLISIDVACKNEKDLTNETWNDAVNKLTLSFEPMPALVKE